MTALLETIALQKTFGAVIAASDISIGVEQRPEAWPHRQQRRG